jgi:SpoVK/Ycf46/Vps4 family AAA+-type ATPase
VELHASHFVAGGLPQVQRTADRIFKQLMQLDRTVILFDEIDELVRERESEEADAFGRFLTTSMLPRLAELWDRRKVMYFVATNHINYFDSAIIRAERFDAIVPVPPPSFDKKMARIKELLEERGLNSEIDVDRQSVDESVKKLNDRSPDRRFLAPSKSEKNAALPDGSTLAKFLLIRWDQLDELATIIANLLKQSKTNEVNKDLLQTALRDIADPFLDTKGAFLEYLRSAEYERRDFSKSVVWEVIPCDPARKDGRIRNEQGRCWYDSFDFQNLPADFRMNKPGVVEIVSVGATG